MRISGGTEPVQSAERVHIGSGDVTLPGWVNVDNQRYAGVDRVLDVRHGLPFLDVQLMFAEHFIEHLPYAGAMYFLSRVQARAAR
ncbi:MAG: hypothetical protein ACXWHG_12995 [Thermoanaerobaculia bacterium]